MDPLANINLIIVSIPPGAGSSFLGYLQKVYSGTKDYKTESQFPPLNFWDCMLQNVDLVQHWDSSLFGEFKTFTSIITEIDLSSKTVFVNTHSFPTGDSPFNMEHVSHVLSVEGDFDAHLYMAKLKSLKTKNPKSLFDINDITERATKAYERQLISKSTFKPNTSINYNKFFIDVDRKEISKFLIRTMEIKRIDEEKLDIICDMIAIYTRLNQALIKTTYNQ